MPSSDVSWDERTGADAGRLWAGGAVTALIAAGVALIGVMVLHRVLHVAVLTPGGRTSMDNDATTLLPLSAALATLVATALLHLLMSTTPRAPHFFGWIGGLVLALVILQVFFSGTDRLAQFETAAFYLVIGVAITSSLVGVSRTAVRHHRHQDYRETYRPAYEREPRPYERNGYESEIRDPYAYEPPSQRYGSRGYEPPRYR